MFTYMYIFASQFCLTPLLTHILSNMISVHCISKVRVEPFLMLNDKTLNIRQSELHFILEAFAPKG